MPGYIKLYREIQEHWIYKNSDYFKVWVEMLINARYVKEPKTDTYKGVLYMLEYGQFIYGRPAWSKRLGVGEQKLRGIIKKMLNDNMIKIIKHLPSSTIYEVVNYEKYNQHNNHVPDLERSDNEDNENQQDNQHSTSIQPALNQHSTTKEEGKERKKVKKDIIYTLIFETFYKNFPRPQAKADTFKNWNALLKTYTEEQLLQFAENYRAYYESIPEADKPFAYSSNNFFGKKAYYLDFAEPKKWEGKQKPRDKPPQSSNFEQRQYSDDYFDGLYKNTGGKQ